MHAIPSHTDSGARALEPAQGYKSISNYYSSYSTVKFAHNRDGRYFSTHHPIFDPSRFRPRIMARPSL